MKKLLGWCLLLLVVACEGPEGPEGPRGPKGEDGTDMYVSPIYEIRSNEWSMATMPDGSSKGWVCEIKEDNLLAEDYDYSAVNAYMYIGDNFDVKTPLPNVEVSSDGAGHTYTEHYSFEFIPGFVTFTIKSDSPVPLTPPGVCYFQIVITY